MAKIQRKTQKIFGQNGNTDEFAQFGTMKLIENGGNPTYSKDVEVLQNNAAYLIGWQNAVIAGYAPFLEELNTICYTLTYQMAYLLQNGIPEWDDGTTYYINSIVVGSDSKIYRCKTDNCLNVNPVTDDGTNWYDYELNAANLDLSNISNIGKAFINNSKALETGGVSDNSTIYADVIKYNHSTFDSSKFTLSSTPACIVGSPIINDNGLYYGFPSGGTWYNSYVKYNFDFDTFLAQGSGILVIRDTFRPVETDVARNVFETTTGLINLQRGNQLNCYPIINGSSKSVLISNMSTAKFYDYEITINAATSTVSFRMKENESVTWGETASYPITAAANPTTYFKLMGAKDEHDLKQFAVWVDGILVFNGNKTGIDTIKADNYTVVGIPTISADGVASGFSASNYIEPNVSDFSTADNWEVDVTYNANSTSNGEDFIIYSSGLMVSFFNNARTYIKLKLTDNSSVNIPLDNNKLANTVYYLKIKYDVNNGYTIYSSTDGLNYTLANSNATTTKIQTTSDIKLGSLANSYYFDGKIDLNGFKVYVNGDLVYQPCLYIPYTESKTGSKVCDVAYYNRVASMYEQKGIAPYYTIDEVNANFTLPMGEIYGGKLDRTIPHIVENYVNGTSSYELYSPDINGKKLLIQRGLVTMSDNSGSQVVNLLKNYDDTNYWVIANHTYTTTTIPDVTGVDMIATESMTTSSFRVVGSTNADTPSAQGTLVYWEAKGYIS